MHALYKLSNISLSLYVNTKAKTSQTHKNVKEGLHHP